MDETQSLATLLVIIDLLPYRFDINRYVDLINRRLAPVDSEICAVKHRSDFPIQRESTAHSFAKTEKFDIDIHLVVPRMLSSSVTTNAFLLSVAFHSLDSKETVGCVALSK